MNLLIENSLNLAIFLIDNKIVKLFDKVYIFQGKVEYLINNINYYTYSQIVIIINQKGPSKIIISKSNIFISGTYHSYKYDIREKYLTITGNSLEIKGFYKIKIFNFL